MRSFLFISVFLYHWSFCFSQTIFKGRLVSALTGKPVKSALIEKDGKLIADTDSLGYFSLDIDSATNIELSFSTTELGSFSISGLHFKMNEVLLISFKPDCNHSPQKDIKEKKIKLLMISNAFSPPLDSKDKLFEKKYKVVYHGCGDGCTGIITDCIEMYNKVIGEFLDKKYGKAWRKEVNKEVLGL
jgi:hypothetical protein